MKFSDNSNNNNNNNCSNDKLAQFLSNVYFPAFLLDMVDMAG